MSAFPFTTGGNYSESSKLVLVRFRLRGGVVILRGRGLPRITCTLTWNSSPVRACEAACLMGWAVSCTQRLSLSNTAGISGAYDWRPLYFWNVGSLS